MCLFFFSSRRRHTRCSRDWSSDVCSSDLYQGVSPARNAQVPHDVSRPNLVTKTQHQVSTAERALLVGVGWKRAPRFPGMPAGEQGRESLSELVELARSAGAEIAGTVFQMRDSADPATLVGRG